MTKLTVKFNFDTALLEYYQNENFALLLGPGMFEYTRLVIQNQLNNSYMYSPDQMTLEKILSRLETRKNPIILLDSITFYKPLIDMNINMNWSKLPSNAKKIISFQLINSYLDTFFLYYITITYIIIKHSFNKFKAKNPLF